MPLNGKALMAEAVPMENRFTLKTIWVDGERFELEHFADLDREFSAHFEEMSDPTKDLPEPPLFGYLWPAAVGLAAYLQDGKISVQGQRVLEIGCGLALPSLLCSRLGAFVETMDHHPDVAALISRNCQRNRLPALPFHLTSFQNTKTILGPFDVIIGSDILYDPQSYPRLEQFIVQQAAQRCRIIIADPGRYAASKFGTLLKQKGLYALDKQKVPDHDQPIEIHRFELG